MADGSTQEEQPTIEMSDELKEQIIAAQNECIPEREIRYGGHELLTRILET